MAVASIIEGIRNYLAECPLLAEIPLKDRHVDWTKADGDGNYGIFPDGNEPIDEPYINGSQEMQYTAQIEIRKVTDTDVKRLEANAFLERLQRYFTVQNSAGNLPEMPKNCVPTEIEAVNAMLLETDTSGKKRTYIIQLHLNYTLYKEYPFHSDFREWIRFESLICNSDVPEIIRRELMCSLIFAGKPPQDVDAAMRFILWFYNGGHEIKKSGSADNRAFESCRVYDFEYDFDYIYAAFTELYGIDLVDVPYLHWWKFRALFKGLHDCRIADIMGYRGADISNDLPDSRKRFLMDMQELYELPVSVAEQRRKAEMQRFLNS